LKPQRIILIRHGESEGNVDKSRYNHKPDYSMVLTAKGRIQARNAGQTISALVGKETVGVYSSPFYRTRLTRDIFSKYLNVVFSKEDPRLREQEWTTLLRNESKKQEEKEREVIGKFYYRFKSGESCADVFDRISTFLETLHRDFAKKDFPKNVIISGHGMTNRIFIMRWLHLTVEEFEILRNPKNAQIYILQLNDKNKYDLVTPLERYPSRQSKF
jgi:broad specificity phosphatase PhoE